LAKEVHSKPSECVNLKMKVLLVTAVLATLVALSLSIPVRQLDVDTGSSHGSQTLVPVATMPLYSAPTNADVQEAILKAQAAAEQSQAVVQQSILIQQSVQQEAADQAMATAAATQAVSEQVAEPVADVSLAVGNSYVRANPSINQYAFSGCYGNDAPDSGHCRPQINSAQGWSSISQSSGWMSIDLQGATRVAGILLQVSVKIRRRAPQISIMEPKTQLTGPQQQLRLQPVAQVRPT